MRVSLVRNWGGQLAAAGSWFTAVRAGGTVQSVMGMEGGDVIEQGEDVAAVETSPQLIPQEALQNSPDSEINLSLVPCSSYLLHLSPRIEAGPYQGSNPKQPAGQCELC